VDGIADAMIALGDVEIPSRQVVWGISRYAQSSYAPPGWQPDDRCGNAPSRSSISRSLPTTPASWTGTFAKGTCRGTEDG